MAILIWILFFLCVIILILAIALLVVIKKATYLSKKEKDMTIFAIDMYIDYAEELEITSVDKHNIIVKELENIKNKFDG